MTSSDLCVTRDILCFVTWVVVHQRILLTKFGRNWTFGYGARGLMPEEEEEEERTRAKLSSEMTKYIGRELRLLDIWPQMNFKAQSILIDIKRIRIKSTFRWNSRKLTIDLCWPFPDLWLDRCDWLFFLSYQCTVDATNPIKIGHCLRFLPQKRQWPLMTFV